MNDRTPIAALLGRSLASSSPPWPAARSSIESTGGAVARCGPDDGRDDREPRTTSVMSTYVYVGEGEDQRFTGLREQGARKPVQRRTIDHSATAVRHVESRVYQKNLWDNEMLQPTSGAMLDFLPPVAYAHLPATSFATKFVHVSTNKVRSIHWSPYDPVRVVNADP
jgi:hypothetical protein